MSTLTNHIKLRDLTPGDLNFILSYWTKEAGTRMSTLDKQAGFWSTTTFIIEYLISVSTTKIITSTTDSKLILGFVVFKRDTDTPIIHMLFVKKNYRREGVANWVLDEIFSNRTFHTILFTSGPRRWQRQWIKQNGYKFNDRVPSYKFISSISNVDESLEDFTKGAFPPETVVTYRR